MRPLVLRRVPSVQRDFVAVRFAFLLFAAELLCVVGRRPIILGTNIRREQGGMPQACRNFEEGVRTASVVPPAR